MSTLLYKTKIKHFIAKIIFGKPLIMSVYQDKNGKYYGGTIHKDEQKSYIDNVNHIDSPLFIGKTTIYI